ncbi:DUF551 domain-containing protein [Klebsiella grimontii]|uniref:DUF551 domain-containing protein n=3 Tax=Klebsiella grimontii TaxID=2058152 RepID=UPI00397CA61A
MSACDNVLVNFNARIELMLWTSVKFKMPETTKMTSWFIVNTAKGVGVTTYSPLNGFSKTVFIDNETHQDLEVTHWMPLPHPPES